MEKVKHYLGLDVGGTNMVAGVVDSHLRLIEKVSIPTRANKSVEIIVSDMVKVTEEVIKKSHLSIEDFESWGIGMPSCINPKTHLLVHANCFGWKNIPIYDYLNGCLPLPINIENDANCAAFGEKIAGVGQNYDNMLMLTLGTGVGGGIIIDRKIYSGADGMGAELGHSKLVYDGKRCTCGQKGCMEAYCSSTALIRESRKAIESGKKTLLHDYCEGNMDNLNGRIIFKAMHEGDNVAKEIIDNYINHLAAGISTLITIFRPEVIVLGGGISHSGNFLFDKLNSKLHEVTFGGSEIGVPPVIPAKLGNDAGIIGAALLGEMKQMK